MLKPAHYKRLISKEDTDKRTLHEFTICAPQQHPICHFNLHRMQSPTTTPENDKTTESTNTVTSNCEPLTANRSIRDGQTTHHGVSTLITANPRRLHLQRQISVISLICTRLCLPRSQSPLVRQALSLVRSTWPSLVRITFNSASSGVRSRTDT